MPRIMSFSITKEQMRAGTKDVTRRLGWSCLRPREVLWAVEKAQGLKRGEKMVRMGKIMVKSIRCERLDRVTKRECIREGFPNLSPAAFVRMFCEANGCDPKRLIYRIEFMRVGKWE